MGTIKRLPDIAVRSQSDSDKELIIDILIQLLQSQVPVELQIVRSSLEKAASQLPAVASRQLWGLASSTSEPVLQEVAISWITSTGKVILGSAPEFAAGGITAVKNISETKPLGRILPTLLALKSMKGGDDEVSKQLLTDLLDALVAKAPDASLLVDLNENSQDYIAFLPKWVVNILSVSEK
jgi:predicted HTH domain antitoxin